MRIGLLVLIGLDKGGDDLLDLRIREVRLVFYRALAQAFTTAVRLVGDANLDEAGTVDPLQQVDLLGTLELIEDVSCAGCDHVVEGNRLAIHFGLNVPGQVHLRPRLLDRLDGVRGQDAVLPAVAPKEVARIDLILEARWMAQAFLGAFG